MRTMPLPTRYADTYARVCAGGRLRGSGACPRGPPAPEPLFVYACIQEAFWEARGRAGGQAGNSRQ